MRSVMINIRYKNARIIFDCGIIGIPKLKENIDKSINLLIIKCI